MYIYTTNNWMLEIIVPLNPSIAKKSIIPRLFLNNNSSLTVVSANKNPEPIHSISPSTGLLPIEQLYIRSKAVIIMITVCSVYGTIGP